MGRELRAHLGQVANFLEAVIGEMGAMGWPKGTKQFSTALQFLNKLEETRTSLCSGLASQPAHREGPSSDLSWCLQLLCHPYVADAAKAILRYIGELTSEKAWELPIGKALVAPVQDFCKQLVLDKLEKDEKAAIQLNAQVGRPHIARGTHEADVMEYSHFGWGEHCIASDGALKSLLEEGLIQVAPDLHNMQTVRWGPSGKTTYERDGSSHWQANLQVPWEARAEKDGRQGTWYVRTNRELEHLFLTEQEINEEQNNARLLENAAKFRKLKNRLISARIWRVDRH